MKNNKKGFIPMIVVGVVVLALIGGASLLDAYNKNSTLNNSKKADDAENKNNIQEDEVKNVLKTGDVPDQLLNLGSLTKWEVNYGVSGTIAFRYRDCQNKAIDVKNYDIVSMTYFIDYDIEDKVSTSRINELNTKISNYMKGIGWPAISLAEKYFGSAPDTYCYEKDSTIVTYSIGTGRCTMNTPCRAYDTINLDIFFPKKGNSEK